MTLDARPSDAELLALAQARQAGKRSTSSNRVEIAKRGWETRRRNMENATRPRPTVPFRLLCQQAGLPIPVAEYCFAMPRRWRADFCWPTEKLILEVEGGVWIQGRHTRGSGFVRDMEKYNHAATMGYRILRVTPSQLCTEETLTLVRAALTTENANHAA